MIKRTGLCPQPVDFCTVSNPPLTATGLFLGAGGLWSLVAWHSVNWRNTWLAVRSNGRRTSGGRLAGLTARSPVFYHFGFSRLVLKNIERINRQPDRVCVFAFQTWEQLTC